MQVMNKFIPHEANLQQRKHLERIHHKLKRHELLECLVQFQQVMKLTEKKIKNKRQKTKRTEARIYDCDIKFKLITSLRSLGLSTVEKVISCNGLQDW